MFWCLLSTRLGCKSGLYVHVVLRSRVCIGDCGDAFCLLRFMVSGQAKASNQYLLNTIVHMSRSPMMPLTEDGIFLFGVKITPPRDPILVFVGHSKSLGEAPRWSRLGGCLGEGLVLLSLHVYFGLVELDH